MHSDQGSVDGAEDPDVSSVCLECARACALPAWIDAFRDVSWPTVVVPVGDDAAAFAGFLDAAGGMRLPAPPVDAALPPHDPRFALTRPSALDSAPDVGGDQQRHAPGGFAAAVVQSSDGGDGDDSTGSDGGASVATFSPPLPTLEAAMRAAIAELGGSAFVKLDWTAPADAAWAADAPDLQCPTPGHAFTLLGASDLVRYDVALLRALRAEAAVRGAPPPGAHVVLRAWFPLQRDGEFRCFVRRGALVAVSQRHTRERFAQLTGVGASARVRGALADFHARRVQPRFPLHTCACVCGVACAASPLRTRAVAASAVLLVAAATRRGPRVHDCMPAPTRCSPLSLARAARRYVRRLHRPARPRVARRLRTLRRGHRRAALFVA